MNEVLKSTSSRVARCIAAGALVAAAAVAAPDASAALDMFLLLDGIKGESRDKQHSGEIDVLAWSWGLGSFKSTVGRVPAPNTVCAQPLTLTKWQDKATIQLLKSAVLGLPILSAKLTLRKAGVAPVEYFVVTLDHVNVTSLTTGGSGGEDRLTENVAFSFSSAVVEYTEQNIDGSIKQKTQTSLPASCP